MRTPVVRAVCILAAAALLRPSAPLAPAQGRPDVAVVSAADSFLATLTPEQRSKVLYRYDDAQQRARWSNLPTGLCCGAASASSR